MEQQNALSRPEKLKSRKEIDALFAQRAGFAVAPVRVLYSISQSPETDIKAGFGCSKRYFRHAVRRNRAKRLMREAYRTQKQALWQIASANGQSLHLFFLFSHNELISCAAMQNVFAIILQKLGKILENKMPRIQE